MRLIDADALLDAISVHLERIEQEFEDAPTIEAEPDAEPVRRGKWVRDETDKWRCSACGAGNNYAYEWSVGGKKLQDNYCPKCGAKMEDNNETD